MKRRAGSSAPTGLEPAGVETTASCLRVGDGWATTLVVTGWPSEVGMGWLEPLLQWQPTPDLDRTASPAAGVQNARLDVAVHIDPLPVASATARLRKQRARLESARRIDAGRGRLDDPLVDAAAADAADLADLVARGESRLFSVAVYLSVHAPTRAGLHRAVAEVRATAASVLLDTQPATWRQLSGWCSTLPLGHDGLGMARVMDTAAVAASFPLATQDLPAPFPGDDDSGGRGVLFGLTNAGVLWWDRWAQDNHNSVVLARSGAGKSYLVKLDVLRNLYTGVQVHVIDPEDEYARLAQAVGGTLIQLGAPGVTINPLDLHPHSATNLTSDSTSGQSNGRDGGWGGWLPADTLTRRALFLHTLVGVLLGEPVPPGERAALDRAITATYAAAGITQDPATWHRPAPLLRDLVTTLSSLPADTRPGRPAQGQAVGLSDGELLASRLAPWVEGSFRHLFDGPTTTGTPTGTGFHRDQPGRHLVVWSTRHLPDELRAAGMLLALDATWRDIDTTGSDSHPGPDTHRSATPLANGPANGVGNGAGQGPGWVGNQGNGLPGWAPNQSGPAATGTPGQAPVSGPDAAGGRARRLVVVDEAWSLMREPDGARFLARMAKSARKRNAGLAVVTQDAADLLGSELGQVVVANAATQILMRQAPQAIAAVAATFGLSPGEAQLLLGAQRGQALLLGSARVAFTSTASAWEHHLATTSADDRFGDDTDAGGAR